MKLSYNWLKESVSFSFSPQELLTKLCEIGILTASLEQTDDGDWIYEFERLPSRPDWLSCYGIAREIGAISGKKWDPPPSSFSLKNFPKESRNTDKLFSVHVLDSKNCPRYSFAIFSNLNMKDSPLWMRKRLEIADIQPINTVVDITNYVMIECGQPLHAFDLDKVDGNEIFIQRAEKERSFLSLNQIDYQLNDDALVISDASQHLALAGIVGSFHAQVSSNTKRILLESAYFNPSSIRKTARYLGISTQASYRFERGMDPHIVPFALQRAGELISKYAEQEDSFSYFYDHYPKKIKNIEIFCRASRIQNILGISDMTMDHMKKILFLLQCHVEIVDHDMFKVLVPTFRTEISEEVDVAEEIARMYGYKNIPQKFPAIRTLSPLPKKRVTLVEVLRNESVICGLKEVITHTCIHPKEQRDVKEKNIELFHPLSKEQSVLRQSLIPGLAKIFYHHLIYPLKTDSFEFFEIGQVFESQKNKMGKVIHKEYENWSMISAQGIRRVRGCMEHLLNKFNLSQKVLWSLEEMNPLDSCQTLFCEIDGQKCGYLFILSSRFLKNFSFKNIHQLKEVCVGEFYVNPLLKKASLKKKFQPFSRYPSVERDLVLKMPKDFSCEKILSLIKNLPLKFLKNIELFDIYTGNQLKAHEKSLGFSLSFHSLDKTLLDKDVDHEYNMILIAMEKEFGITLREK